MGSIVPAYWRRIIPIPWSLLCCAVLCDFGDREPQEVVTYIVHRLRELLGADERRFREHMTMPQILSRNRDLEAQIKEVEHMPTEIDIESMPFFSIGFERGERKGWLSCGLCG